MVWCLNCFVGLFSGLVNFVVWCFRLWPNVWWALRFVLNLLCFVGVVAVLV